MLFDDRCSIENIHFIYAVPKKDGTSGISLLPTIVSDLKLLENGVVMFFAEQGSDALVVSPVLRIEADSLYHSELCSLLGPTALYPCRKRYMRLRRSRREALQDVRHYTGKQLEQTREHYRLATADNVHRRSKTIPSAPEFGNGLHACDLSYSHRNIEALLELKALDSPDLVQVVLKGDKAGKLKKLAHCINKFQEQTGLSRKFNKKLQHCDSLPGRDIN